MVLPADKWQFLGAGEVMPITLFILGRSAVNYGAFSARLSLFLIPGKIVSSGVVHPLVLAFLSNIVHADPVSLVIVTTNQSADQLVLSIVVNRDEVSSPLHAYELS